MSITEVFPNPTVKQVIFQIQFPNLFYIESKIGEFQTKIISEFPESALKYSKMVSFGEVGPNAKAEDLTKQILEGENSRKIWEFKSPKKIELNVTSSSIDLNSRFHKTYDNEGSEKFRDILKFTIDKFLNVVPIPKINRIGLRYIDECPIISKNTTTFNKYYHSVFPTKRFGIEDAKSMVFNTNIRRGDFDIIYTEALAKKDDNYKLIIDIDGSAANTVPEKYLEITDELHRLISTEYEKTIKEPVYEYMRGKTK
jgi:uncharacterized protein (TIGR04255 family)